MSRVRACLSRWRSRLRFAPGDLSLARVPGELEREAADWMRRFADGRMTREEGEAFRQWCARTPRHAAAFASQRRRWRAMQQAGGALLARRPELAQAWVADEVPDWQRRAVLGGAVTATAAVAGVALLRPPLGLWAPVTELRADYRTGVGEQRRVALAGHVTVELNTRTSIALRRGAQGLSGIELIAGEAAIELADAGDAVFAVEAGAVRVSGRAAAFEVRREAARICVTCVSGQVDVERSGARHQLREAQQFVSDAANAGTVAEVDAQAVSAWRAGFLRFRDTPLGTVVDEINRYRRGRIVLLDEALALRPVTGRFALADLDAAVLQIRQSFGLGARSFPGGLLLLG